MNTLFTTVLTIVALSISGCVTINPTPVYHDDAAHAAAIASQEVKIEEYITGSFDWRCFLVVNKGKILRLLEPKLVTISVTSTGRCNMSIVVDDEGPTQNTMKFIPAGTSTALVKWPVTKHIVLERSHTQGGTFDYKAKGSYIIKVYPMPTTPTQ